MYLSSVTLSSNFPHNLTPPSFLAEPQLTSYPKDTFLKCNLTILAAIEILSAVRGNRITAQSYSVRHIEVTCMWMS